MKYIAIKTDLNRIPQSCFECPYKITLNFGRNCYCIATGIVKEIPITGSSGKIKLKDCPIIKIGMTYNNN